MKWKCFLFQWWRALLFTFWRVQHTAPLGSIAISTVVSRWVNKNLLSLLSPCSLLLCVLSQPYFRVVIVRNSLKYIRFLLLALRLLNSPLIPPLSDALHPPFFSAELTPRRSLERRTFPPRTLLDFPCVYLNCSTLISRKRTMKKIQMFLSCSPFSSASMFAGVAIQKKAPKAKQWGFRSLI